MKMGLGSAPVFSAPSIFKQHHNHLKPAIKAPQRPVADSFLRQKTADCKTSVVVQRINGGRWSMQMQSVRKSNKLRVVCRQVKVEDSISDDEACELVSGTELIIDEAERSGGIQAYLFQAVKNNNQTGILLLSDIFGFQDSSNRDFAYRVACNGYNVLVPDLFNGDPWGKDRPNAKLQEWINKHKPEQIAETVFASAEWMKNEFAAAGISKKLGIIGFCYGGGRVIDILAQDKDSYFGSGVSFYGTRVDSSVASKIKVPLLMITGDGDALCPVSILEDITKRNEESKVVVYQGRGHGFAHRPQSPEEDADAEEAFVTMRNWLHDGLLLVGKKLVMITVFELEKVDFKCKEDPPNLREHFEYAEPITTPAPKATDVQIKWFHKARATFKSLVQGHSYLDCIGHE